MSTGRVMRPVLRDLQRRGFTITRTNGKHWRIEHPDLAHCVFAPATPSDHRSIKNVMAQIRRTMRKETA